MSNLISLDSRISDFKGVGPKTTKKLIKLEIESIGDLLYHFPTRYLDFSKIEKIANLKIGEERTIKGEVWQIKNRATKGRLILTQALVSDSSGTCEVIWFNQPYLTRNIKQGLAIYLSGKPEIYHSKLMFINPEYEIVRENIPPIHTARLVPIYPETRGLSSRWLRLRIFEILEELEGKIRDFLPGQTKIRQNLDDLSQALEKIHFPQNLEEAQESRKRLAFEELFQIQIVSLLKRKKWKETRKTRALRLGKKVLDNFKGKLPFKLTNAQGRVIYEILSDLERQQPANRLLCGDVGSGKTVVAAACALAAFYSGTKSVVMAPTEILAFQHWQTLSLILGYFGVKVTLYTRTRKEEQGDVIVGTHALIHSKKPFENVGLVVIDEQHRFGVLQRKKIFVESAKGAGFFPHFLTLSATPIPRSLALTLYGDLDLSLIDELPPGRKKVQTYIVPPEKREGAYDFLRKKIQEGRQAFIICPLIELSETLDTVKAATHEFEHLSKEIFPDLSLGLLHGRMKSKEKEKVLTQFKEKKLNILVATPVVEVGIDVPNATIMIIEGAERFGLAQLHQLRGRIARSTYDAYCFLFSNSKSLKVVRRLSALRKIDLGFKLAEIDLSIRGPGEIFGTKQHGLPKLKVADLTDLDLIEKARREAEIIILQGPLSKNYPLLVEEIKKKFQRVTAAR
jgi:ATP-dependent DNA helicase RecG